MKVKKDRERRGVEQRMKSESRRARQIAEPESSQDLASRVDEMVATSMMCSRACARAGRQKRPGDSTGGCRPGRPSGLEIKELAPGRTQVLDRS